MKQITLNVPDDAIAGAVTLIKMQNTGYGLELLTRNFDFQVKNGTTVNFISEETP